MKTVGDVLRPPHARLLALAVALTTTGAAVAGAVVLVGRSARVIEHVAARVVAEPIENAAADGELAPSASPKIVLRRTAPRSMRPGSAPRPHPPGPSRPATDEGGGTPRESGEGPPITF